MTGNKVWGKSISLCIVLVSCFLMPGFGENGSRQGEQSPVSFYEKLLLSGEKAFFSGEYDKAIKELEIAAFGLFLRKFSAAKAYVSASLMEGFGLPGLEAASVGCPVVCSDIPTFKEIYGLGFILTDCSKLIYSFHNLISLLITLAICIA